MQNELTALCYHIFPCGVPDEPTNSGMKVNTPHHPAFGKTGDDGVSNLITPPELGDATEGAGVAGNIDA